MTSISPALAGLHHVTAITADAQKNIDFYCGVLGLRLVKLTVNFDDPASYHLYYGDELGHPGSILTFFAWPGAGHGRTGPPQVTLTAFAVPADSLSYWSMRLGQHGVLAEAEFTRFGEQVLGFSDPDGLRIELIAVKEPAGRPWLAGPVPAEHALRGFHSVTLAEEGYENTATLLSEIMGFRSLGREGNRFRFEALGQAGLGSTVDVLCVPDSRSGQMGAGVVHHVAFRTPNDSQQIAWRRIIMRQGLGPTPVIDRNYFHSIYYREPGGVLFEIATEPPGFTIDEPAEHLGSRLMLPPQYEPYRAAIERHLPPVHLPAGIR